MNRFTLIILLIFVAAFNTNGQNSYSKAILIPKYNNPDRFVDYLNKRLYEPIRDYSDLHVFDWDEETHSVRFINPNKEIKKPIDVVKFLGISLSGINLRPSIEIKTDTTGKTIGVQYTINPSATFYIKSVEVKTSKITDYFKLDLYNSDRNISNVIIVSKFLEEFGGDPNKIKKADSKLYDKLVEKLTDKYKPIFEERYKEFIKSYVNSVLSAITTFQQENDKTYSVIRNPEDNDEKKIKYVSFNAGVKDSLRIGTTLMLYEIVNFENRKSTKYINNLYVDEIGQTQSKAKLPMFSSRKELAETLRSPNELLFFHNRYAARKYNKNMNNNYTEYNAAVKKNCLFCDYYSELMLISIPVVNLIERNAVELRKFQEMAKLDKFIDYNSQELLNKQLGVRYLFYKDANNLMSTDIETGKIIGSEGTYKNSTKTIVKNLFIETFDKKIEFLKNNEVSKNKVKEIILYSDFGFSLGEDMIIYKYEDEKVGNKTIKRKVVVGDGSVSKTISDFIGILKIDDGEKELYELQNQKKEFFVEYKINQK